MAIAKEDRAVERPPDKGRTIQNSRALSADVSYEDAVVVPGRIPAVSRARLDPSLGAS